MAHVRVKKASLAEVVPTEEELEETRRLINSASEPRKKERACMASMSNWLKQHGSQENADVVASRGEQRKRFLENFMVLQSREKKAKTCQTTTRSSGSESSTTNLKGWFSYEFLKGKLGEKRLDTYIERDLIQKKSDARLGELGLTKEYMDYYWDFQTEKHTSFDKNDTTLNTAADDVDIKKAMTQLDSMGEPPSAGATSAGEPAKPLKDETPPTPQELEQKQIRELVSAPAAALQKYQVMLTDLLVMKAAASKASYQEAFCDSIDKFNPKLQKAIKMLECMTLGSSYDTSKVAALLKSLKSLSDENTKFAEHASKFGFVPSTRRRKTRASS